MTMIAVKMLRKFYSHKACKSLAKPGFMVYNITCVTAQCVFMHTRYAMKWKVADSRSGNFHGVCPILNRAAVILNTVCVMLLARGGLCCLLA